MTDKQSFDGTVLKVDIDGNHVLSSYIGPGESRAYDDVRQRTEELDFDAVPLDEGGDEDDGHSEPWGLEFSDAGSDLRLNWNPPDGAVLDHQVWSDPEITVWTDGATPSVLLPRSDFPDAGPYRFRVRASVEVTPGNAEYTEFSPWTDWTAFPAAADTPTNVHVTAGGLPPGGMPDPPEALLQVTWDLPDDTEDIETYEVQSVPAGFSAEILASEPPEMWFFASDKTGVDAGPFQFRVRNKKFGGAQSGEWSAKSVEAVVPSL